MFFLSTRKYEFTVLYYESTETEDRNLFTADPWPCNFQKIFPHLLQGNPLDFPIGINFQFQLVPENRTGQIQRLHYSKSPLTEVRVPILENDHADWFACFDLVSRWALLIPLHAGSRKPGLKLESPKRQWTKEEEESPIDFTWYTPHFHVVFIYKPPIPERQFYKLGLDKLGWNKVPLDA
jgi:hypothetical protein